MDFDLKKLVDFDLKEDEMKLHGGSLRGERKMKAGARSLFRSMMGLFVLIGLIGGVVGCTDKRPEEFPQGSGRSLDRVEELDGREYQVVTGAALDVA